MSTYHQYTHQVVIVDGEVNILGGISNRGGEISPPLGEGLLGLVTGTCVRGSLQLGRLVQCLTLLGNYLSSHSN